MTKINPICGLTCCHTPRYVLFVRKCNKQSMEEKKKYIIILPSLCFPPADTPGIPAARLLFHCSRSSTGSLSYYSKASGPERTAGHVELSLLLGFMDVYDLHPFLRHTSAGVPVPSFLEMYGVSMAAKLLRMVGFSGGVPSMPLVSETGLFPSGVGGVWV